MDDAIKIGSIISYPADAKDHIFIYNEEHDDFTTRLTLDDFARACVIFHPDGTLKEAFQVHFPDITTRAQMVAEWRESYSKRYGICFVGYGESKLEKSYLTVLQADRSEEVNESLGSLYGLGRLTIPPPMYLCDVFKLSDSDMANPRIGKGPPIEMDVLLTKNILADIANAAGGMDSVLRIGEEILPVEMDN